jgi:endonuclease-3
MAQAIVRDHGGQIPDTIEGLCSLPGVARKTANVVLGNALDKHVGIVVDTHVSRVAARLGLTTNTDPVKIEQDLMALVPRDQWTRFGNRMIHHGRYICLAKVPDCEHCPLSPVCPSSLVGRPLVPIAKPPARGRTSARAIAKPRPRP